MGLPHVFVLLITNIVEIKQETLWETGFLGSL